MTSEDQVTEQRTLAAGGGGAAGIVLPTGPLLPQLAALQAGQHRQTDGQASSGELVIGRGIKVKGQIGACKTLVVEGELDASVEVRSLRLLDGGVFKGTAVVQDADLTGRFDGRLTVTGRLRLSPSARVSGQIRYRRIQIEEGGEISGDVAALSAEPDAALEAAAPGPAAKKPSRSVQQ
jgi:cytoskeletal protein CcmA (bactofilin family)